MQKSQPTLTLNRETIVALSANQAESGDRRAPVKLPTTTVLTRYVSCTAC